MYKANAKRYKQMIYKRCGNSGIKLPAISLGLWHNFGGVDTLNNMKQILFKAFDLGITHFDLANNYGPPPGSAEENFGQIIASDLKAYRDELVVSSKAGYEMWEGPYGDWGSKKYLVASINQSLVRMGLEYVDIFYHHRPDPETPLEETMTALDLIVRQGKALYAGISNYPADLAKKAGKILKSLGTPCIIHQPSYSMFNRWIEDGLKDVLRDGGIGCITFSPLAQGLLTNKYLNGIPADSRAAKSHGFLFKEQVTAEVVAKIRKLNDIAVNREQSLAQMAVAWILRLPEVTSVLVGTSKVSQIEDNVAALNNLEFSSNELAKIDLILAG